jgi:hypothetical protein
MTTVNLLLPRGVSTRYVRLNRKHTRIGEFRHVAENRYRYSSSGVYYARLKSKGKEISRSQRHWKID